MSKHTHKTKDGRTAKKGLYYNINKKKKAGKKMRKKGAKGAPSAADFKAAAKTAKKPKRAAAYGGEIKMMKSGGKFPDLSGDKKVTKCAIGKNNDLVFKDSGIEQTWNFAHPNNKKVTGPLFIE